MSTVTKGFTVDQYDALVENGILPETNRFELIDGRIEEKDMKGPQHRTATERTRQAIDRLLPSGWHTSQEAPVRLPNRDGEPEPDVSVIRGTIDDYPDRHPGPDDVALVVEVTRSTVAKDRALIPVYDAGGIPIYWIVNIPDRQLEVYTSSGAIVLTEDQYVDLVIDGQVVGQIAVAELLPRKEVP
ncbi:MAG: Uma2 family endonuclease [Isosphaeraceae bacterium]